MVPGTPLGILDRFKKHTKAKKPKPKQIQNWTNFKGKHPLATPAISAVLKIVIFFPPKFVFLSSCCI